MLATSPSSSFSETVQNMAAPAPRPASKSERAAVQKETTAALRGKLRALADGTFTSYQLSDAAKPKEGWTLLTVSSLPRGPCPLVQASDHVVCGGRRGRDCV